MIRYIAVALAAVLAICAPAHASPVPDIRVPDGTPVLCQPRQWEFDGSLIAYDDVFGGPAYHACMRLKGHGFVITRSAQPFSWGDYPNLFTGCEWNVCSKHSFLPAPVSQLRRTRVTTWTRMPAGLGLDDLDWWLYRRDPGRAVTWPGGEITVVLGQRGYPAHLMRRARIGGRRWLVAAWVTQRGTPGQHLLWQFRPGWRMRHPSVTGLAVWPLLRYAGYGRWWTSALDAGFECIRDCAGDTVLRYLPDFGRSRCYRLTGSHLVGREIASRAAALLPDTLEARSERAAGEHCWLATGRMAWPG